MRLVLGQSYICRSGQQTTRMRAAHDDPRGLFRAEVDGVCHTWNAAGIPIASEHPELSIDLIDGAPMPVATIEPISYPDDGYLDARVAMEDAYHRCPKSDGLTGHQVTELLIAFHKAIAARRMSDRG